MNRVLMSVAALLLALIGLLWPVTLALNFGASVGADPVTITDYRATYDVDADGHLTASETVVAEFPEGRHGIFRFWDVSDPGDPHVRYLPENISITQDGASVPVTMSWEKGKRFRVAKIGNPDRFVDPGEHTYTISYTVDGVLAPASRPAGGQDSSSWGGKDASRFGFRVVADGWQMPIKKSSTKLTLPSTPSAVTCSTGDHSPCQVTGEGTTRIVTTGWLAPSTGVAVRAELPTPPPDRTTLPWSTTFDPVLGRSVPLAIGLGALSLLTFAVGALWTYRSAERPPLLPVMFGPPLDPQDPDTPLSPVQTYYVTREKIPSKALSAALLHMAERGLIRLERQTHSDWQVTSLVYEDVWDRADPVSSAMATALGIRAKDRVFDADGSTHAGQALDRAKTDITAASKKWGKESGAVRLSQAEIIGVLLVVVAFIAAIPLCFIPVIPFTLCVLPLTAFVVGGAGLLTSGVGTRRTRTGRDIWSRAGGFERLLSTPSNTERLDFSARKDLYTSFIPYAVAFGCADAWAKKYRMATGTEPPTPAWFTGTTSTGAAGMTPLMSGIDNFESSLSSSLSAYSATQSSSSSSGGFGGGGFSGGGGGGGGSW